LKQLKPALTSHSRAEEAVVYRALLDVAGSTRAGVLGNAGFIEHGLAEVLLDMLARGRKPVSEEWTARAAALQGLLEHHIAEEHAVMFDELGTHFRPDELEAMGARFLREKRKHAGTRIEETA
jgi:hemerythrin-like domain-containing protein